MPVANDVTVNTTEDSAPVMKDLLQVAYAALASGNTIAAEPIFSAYAQEFPDDAAGSIGKASILLAHGYFNESVEELSQNAINARVNAEEARKVMLVALMMAGRMQEAGRIHQDMMASDGSPYFTKHTHDAQQYFGH